MSQGFESIPSAAAPPPRAVPGDILQEEAFRGLLRKRVLVLLLGLGLPLLVVLALAFYLLHSAAEADRTDHLVGLVHAIEKLAVDMETGLRGYEVTNDEHFLEPFARARERLPQEQAALRALAASDPRLRKDSEALAAAIQRWNVFADGSQALHQAGRSAESRHPAHQRRGKELMDVVRRQAEQMERAVNAERFSRNRTRDIVRASLVVALALAAFAGLPLAASFLTRTLRRLNVSYHASLEASERRATELQVTLRSIGDAVISTDAAGAVTMLNPIAEKLTGWQNEEALGKPLQEVFQIFSEETGEPAENPVERVLREHVVVGLANHTVIRSRDGAERAIEDSAAPIMDDRGAVSGVILVFHDAEEKRAREIKLQQSEARFRFLNEVGEDTRNLEAPEKVMETVTRLLGQHLGASRCLYAEVEPDGEHFRILEDYTDGVPSMSGEYQLSAFGAFASDAMRSGRGIVLNDSPRELAEESDRAIFASAQIVAVIGCPLLKEGRLRAMLSVHQATPRLWSETERELVCEVAERCWATIERARAEKAMRAGEQRSRAIIDTALDGVLLMNEKGMVAGWNPAAERIFGWSREEALGQPLADLIIPEGLREAHWRGLTNYLATGKGPVLGRRLELTALRRDRTEFPVELNISALPGSERVFVGYVRDITEAKRAEKQLRTAKEAAEAASRAKDNFLAALSHELRTPLTPVLMTAAAMAEDERLPAESREQLGVIERSIALEARLIDDLLDLTRIARGKLQLRPEHCDIHSLLGMAVEIVREEAQTRGQVMQFELGAHRTGLMADPARLQQVFWNLLRNAVKFTPIGGRIYIRTRDLDDGALEVEVSDTGIGITPEAMGIIFMPFEQAGLENDHRYGGLGLGLSIAQAIVTSHGGTIRASSPGTGQGATFLVDLPGATEAPHGVDTKSRDEAEPAPARDQPLRLLLLEDHEPTLRVLVRLLTRAGHQVVATSTVAGGLAAAKAGTFDAVISDLGLPDGTGFEAMAELRDKHGLRGIALSGYGMEDDLRRSREAGFVTHLVKPVDFAQLRRALAQLVREGGDAAV